MNGQLTHLLLYTVSSNTGRQIHTRNVRSPPLIDSTLNNSEKVNKNVVNGNVVSLLLMIQTICCLFKSD